MQPYQLTISEAQDKLRHGEITSVELTESVLERIAAVEETVGAYISVQDDLALQMARFADERRATGEDRARAAAEAAISSSLLDVTIDGVDRTRRSWIEASFDSKRKTALQLVNQLSLDEHFVSAPLDHRQLLLN